MADKFEQAKIEHDLIHCLLQCRDMLNPIVKGAIERSNCVAGTRECYGGKRGDRKTMLKDAVKIAKTIQAIIKRTIAEYDRKNEDEDPGDNQTFMEG